jgi:hypothetical protein
VQEYEIAAISTSMSDPTALRAFPELESTHEDAPGPQYTAQDGNSLLDEFHSRVGEVRSIRRELRTLQAYHGREPSQGSNSSGQSSAAQLRDAASRLMQKEKEMDILKDQCLKTGVYREPSGASDSDYIDSLSELGQDYRHTSPVDDPMSYISTGVSSVLGETQCSDDHECRTGFNGGGNSPCCTEAIPRSTPSSTADWCMDSWLYPRNPCIHTLLPYNTDHKLTIPREPSPSEFDDEDASCCDQEHLRPYHYSTLPPLGSTIRLLKLLPSFSRDQEIVCEFVSHNLEEGRHQKYEALSYVWGQAPREDYIKVQKEDGFYSLDVTRTLSSALRALRPKRHLRILWIDAICINQEDWEEKSQQVANMRKIYGMASGVCIWLGEADEDSKMAIDFIQHSVLNFKNLDDLFRNQDAVLGWRAMTSLMQRPWFSRLWVIQEVVLSNHAELYCGARTLSWTDFSDAVSLFVEVEAATYRLPDVTGQNPKIFNGLFEDVGALGASLLVDISSNLVRTSAGKREPLWNLEYLVSKLSLFEVTEPRDVIYSLLSIAKDTMPTSTTMAAFPKVSDIPTRAYVDAWTSRYMHAKHFQINYSLSFVDVCKDFVVFSISQAATADPYYALDILCRPWAPSPKKPWQVRRKETMAQTFDREVLPSWMPNWTGAAYSLFNHVNHKVKLGRQNGDSFVGLPGTNSRNYCAAETRAIDLENLRFKKREFAYSLFVSGFVLDRICKVEVASQGGHIPEEWMEAGGWVNINNDPPDEFWRTLVADRGHNGRNPPSYYPRAFIQSVTRGLTSGSLNTTKLIEEGRSTVVAEFFRRVQSVIWNRSLMKTESGRLGIVSKKARTGDVVCILYGCSVPVLLRRHAKSETMISKERMEDDGEMGERKEAANNLIQQDELGWYELIGECYVHEMMDGEAIRYQDEHGLKSQLFELR